MMKKLTQFASLLILAIMLSFNTYADHLSSNFLFAARMNGGQEVPAVSTNALGLATFNLNYTRDTLCFEMTATGISGAIAGIHIHDGAMGINGPVLVDLTPYVSGNMIKGTLTGATLSDTLIAKMFAGDLYLNLHTAMNMNGEIRGQIVPEEDKGIAVMMDGSQEVPPVTVDAKGLAFFMLQKHNKKLSFNIVADSLTGPIQGIHLHQQTPGQSGPVVADLSSFISGSGNTVQGSVDPTAYLNALMSDSIYVNIHTSNFGNGEIRGQLVMQNYLHFDAMMDTAQETMPVSNSTPAFGQGNIKLNYTFDTLWYNIQATGLTGAITGAHFHNATFGNSGGVVIGIPSGNINGNTISGMITGTALADSFLKEMLEGAIYLNIHTSANPAGEIRGQVYRTFREGYTYHLSGWNEVPQVNTEASGTGMVSIDRDQSSAHFMMVIDSLNGFDAAHFHNQVSGQNGPVIYNITSYHNNGGIFGYWLDTDPNTAFTTAMSNKFRKDSVYVNVHTAANANGEVRGDVGRNLCNEIPTTVSKLGTVNIETSLYPNPANTKATLDLVVSENTKATISLIDMMGRTIWTSDKNMTPGINRVIIPLNGMATGIYSVLIRNESGQTSMKLIKD